MGSTFLLGFCVNERVSKSSLHIYCTYIWQAEKVIPIVQNKLVYVYPNVCLLFLPGRMSKSYPYSGEIIRRAFTFMWNTCLQAKMSALHV